jgi:hypothetical protein
MKLSDLDLLKVGNTFQLIGAIYQEDGATFLVPLPDEDITLPVAAVLEMDLSEWKKFLRQADMKEVEALTRAGDNKGLVKAIIRKTARQIDANVSWAVYRRDGYRCRYCGKDGIPLTVDHLVLWEEGGPSIEENLVASCKKCNRLRGNMQLADWFQSQKYKQVSKRLDSDTKRANVRLLLGIDKIELRFHTRSR